MSDLDRYLDDFGERLAGVTRQRPARRRRRLVFALAAVVASAAALAGVLTAAREPLDPVAEARQALAPPDEIVYMKVTSDSPDAEGPSHAVELWSARNPPRWRLVQQLDPANGVMEDRHGVIRGRQEFSYAGGEQRVYLAERDTLSITRGFGDDHEAALVPTPFNLGSGDVEADLRTMLREGEVTDLGEQQADGRTVRRLVSETGGELRRRLVYDVDPDSFEPIQATLTMSFPPGGDGRALTSRMRVDAYERIPIDETSVKLLEIQTTPRTKVTVREPATRRYEPPPEAAGRAAGSG